MALPSGPIRNWKLHLEGKVMNKGLGIYALLALSQRFISGLVKTYIRKETSRKSNGKGYQI